MGRKKTRSGEEKKGRSTYGEQRPLWRGLVNRSTIDGGPSTVADNQTKEGWGKLSFSKIKRKEGKLRENEEHKNVSIKRVDLAKYGKAD